MYFGRKLNFNNAQNFKLFKYFFILINIMHSSEMFSNLDIFTLIEDEVNLKKAKK